MLTDTWGPTTIQRDIKDANFYQNINSKKKSNEFKLKDMSNSDGSEEKLDNTELSDDNYVTYIIGEGTEIVIHRFKIELEDGQDIEAVIKQLDDEMEAMHGQIRFRMDWNYTV